MVRREVKPTLAPKIGAHNGKLLLLVIRTEGEEKRGLREHDISVINCEMSCIENSGKELRGKNGKAGEGENSGGGNCAILMRSQAKMWPDYFRRD